MAVALVGSAGAAASGTTSVTPSFGQATTSGNHLICWAACPNAGSTNLSISGTGWNLATGAFATVAIFYKENCGASESAPTVTGQSGETVYAALAEFSGVAPSSSLDRQNVSITGSVSVSHGVTTGELLVSADSCLLSKAGTDSSSDAYTNGATPTTNLNNDATSTAFHYRFAWGTPTSIASNDQNTFTSTSMNFVSDGLGIATFKLPSVGPTPPGPNVVDTAVARSTSW